MGSGRRAAASGTRGCDDQRQAHVPRLREERRPTGLKIAAETEDAGKQAFAFDKDKKDLVKAIDGALDELRADGTLAKISDKYFGADVTE
jgi:ABC-type amino acid transport substrate-binding protein